MTHAQPAFNSQPYSIQLRDAGFNQKQSQVLLPIIEQQELTKHDMNQLETKFDKFQLEVAHELKEVRRDIQDLRQEVKRDIQDLRQETQGDIHDLRQEIRRDLKELRTELKTDHKQLATDLLIKLGGLMVLLLTLFSGLLGLFIKFLH